MTISYSVNAQYEFDILPDNLGFFKRRQIINLKINEKPENTLFFISKNKVLSVEVEDGCTSWLPYDKALFFYDLFHIKGKSYVLISENDNYFYGYIDQFPCVFNDDYVQAINILSQYSEGENIFQYGIGNVKIDHIENKPFYKIYNMFNNDINKPCSNSVMEEETEYETYSESKITNICLKWKSLIELESKRKIKMCCFWMMLGSCFFLIGYFIV